MIQDIGPGRFRNEYLPRTPQGLDVVCMFSGQGVLARMQDGRLRLPTVQETGLSARSLQYLFTIDQYAWFLAPEAAALPGYDRTPAKRFRDLRPQASAFGMVTAFQLWGWYRDNRLCSRCGQPLSPDTRERALRCPACGLTVYPRINPAVIVAVCSGDALLLTKYAGREFTRFALIAGYCEFGETPEQTAVREVREEVGVEITQLHYYKSQPWSLSSTLLLGFFARLQGPGTLHPDLQELSVAQWTPRAQVAALGDDGVSLTREMMGVFGRGEDPFSKQAAL